MIRETSMEAYKNLDLIESEAKIMRFFHSQRHGATFNRRQVSVLSGIPINCVAGRINSLVAKGYLEELDAERDPQTGKSAHPVRIRAAQPSLFDFTHKGAMQ